MLREITSEIFFNELEAKSSVSDLRMIEAFRLSDFRKERVDFSIQIKNAIVSDFDLSFTTFSKKVRIEDSKIKSFFGMSCHFNSGFELVNCEVFGDTDLSCGGHNRAGAVFLIKNCIFHGAVTFSDNWFEVFVVIEGNDFKKGTDLLYDGHKPTTVTFDKGCRIENNCGELGVCLGG